MERSAAHAASSTSTTQPRRWDSCRAAAGSASRSSCCYAASGCARLADVELAVHARGLVAVDRAIERVLARLQVDAHGRLAALADDLALLVDAALQGDVVLEGGRVG